MSYTIENPVPRKVKPGTAPGPTHLNFEIGTLAEASVPARINCGRPGELALPSGTDALPKATLFS